MCNLKAMDLKPELHKGIAAYRFEEPTTIQQHGIMPIISGKDVTLKSLKGTGKTTALVIAILQKIDTSVIFSQAVVIVRTREKALDLQQRITVIGSLMKVSCIVCVGGTSPRIDLKKLETGAQVVVASPGRATDLMFRGALKADNIKLLVVDRVGQDECQVGFVRDRLAPNVQIVQILDELEKFGPLVYLKYPVQVVAEVDEHLLDAVPQFHIVVEKEHAKVEELCKLVASMPDDKFIVFYASRSSFETLKDALVAHEIASTLCAKMDQGPFGAELKEFRTGSSHVLVVTGTAFGHVDAQANDVIVNYDFTPKHQYFYRIARSGSPHVPKCIVISLVKPNEVAHLKALEQHFHTSIPAKPEGILSLTKA